MAKWDKRTLKLPEKHGWQAKPGYKIFVADRGAVRFDFPEDWVVIPGDGLDQVPRQAAARRRLHPGDVGHEAPAGRLERPEAVDPGRASSSRTTPGARPSEGEIVDVHRTDLDLAWAEVEFIDPNEKRPARSRTCLARASNVQPLITFDFWEDQAPRLGKIWDEILRSLRVAEPILDPRLGQPNRG